MENDFAERLGPRVSLQGLICLKEEGIAGEGELDSSLVTGFQAWGTRKGQRRQDDEGPTVPQ